LSSKIIAEQVLNVENKQEKPLEAMHKLREQASMMKDVILKGEFERIGELLDFGWKYKKEMAGGISNPVLDRIYRAAIAEGASGGKISGAGGGGYMIFFCPGSARYDVAGVLNTFEGRIEPFEFTQKGLTTWTIQD
jgi:D-glycero-alpha-D-manno-heptose-7-phosphate kinase